MTPEDVDTWKRALIKFRQKKDEFFGSDHDSPLGHGASGAFRGLRYFEPDPALRLEVKLQRYPNLSSVIMTTSKGTRQLFNKVGYFELVIGGQAARLQAYQSAEREDASIFVPFRDATSGNESYGAARYLDLEVEHNDEYAVDFNYAYNPYCAYSDDYLCPLPPRENWLPVPIPAGEKKYHD
ncbi:MAG: DUF1684 domain-containing protein [Nitrososphaerales archaeon]|nr:DUF1684 domain-containing protein [Nitrososphaerales archaeon]